MRTATLIRDKRQSGDDGTFGVFTLDDGTHYYSGELPWRNNEAGYSCIPTGVYVAKLYNSPTHGYCYMLTGTEPRSDVEIHVANYCGDRRLGLLCDLRGCICLGMHVGLLENQKSILMSGTAFKDFMARINGEDLEITITEA